ncbi:hypothetical protein ABEF93_002054 [Exophiala dermatitidis]
MTTREEAAHSAGAVKHRKRVLTPARREQNRIAQRLYRQRQKTRRQGQHSSSLRKPLDLRPRVRAEGRECHAHQLPVGEHGLPEDWEAEICARVGLTRGNTSDQGQPFPLHPLVAESSSTLEDFMAMGINAAPTNLEFTSYQLPSELLHELQSPTAGSQETHCPNLSFGLEDTFDASIPFGSQANARNDPDDENNNPTLVISGLQLENSIWAPDPSPHTYTSEASSVACSTSSSSSQYMSSRLRVPSGGYSGSAEIDSAVQSSSARPLAGPARSHGLAPDNINPQLPDPWCNNIQFNSTTIFNAFLTIALRLGFNLRELVDAKNCLNAATRSPFYCPTTPQNDPQALLAAAQLPFAPSNLQPTLPQILIPHHPFLDLIPFPAIRASAITLAAAMPNAFSMTELKKDVYVHGALICWVGGRGIGSSQPWDPRSWEAAPWFLHKWRLLLGGETGEMWKTSTWWRECRRNQ